MLITILRRRLFWLCCLLLLLSIGASMYMNRTLYSICRAGEFASKLLCPNNPGQQFSIDFYTTPEPDSASGTIPVTKTAVLKMPQAWNGKERVNVLLLGIDQRQGELDPGYRTDTMLVLTLDPFTLQAGMLSLPRDLWVPIPGYDNGRINTANFLGDSYNYPGGGPELARKTVEEVLGIPIHYYVRINFTAFEQFIDRIGGITVDVPYDIYDPEYPTNDYRTEVFSITKGVHRLDGATTLKFARTRHSLTNGDFDRARDQQLVILAVKDRLTDPQVFLSLLSSAPDVINQLSASVKTDMTFDQMQQLASLAVKVDRKSIKTAVLDQTYTESAATLTDPPQWVQVPIRSRITQLRDTFFQTTANAAVEITTNATAPAVQATPSATLTTALQAEKARIVVLNGTNRGGLAQRVADILTSKGFDVTRVGDPPDGRKDYNHTVITDYGEKKLTRDALADVLGIQSSLELKRLLNPSAEADIVVILGADVSMP